MENVEIWKDIEGYEKYQISNYGRVKNTNYRNKGYAKITNSNFDKNKYLLISLVIGKIIYTKKVHRLVAQAFIPNLENKETVNHINGIKTDNRVENLEWCTVKENNQHAFDNMLNNRKGVEVLSSKLLEKHVIQIRSIKGEFTAREISKTFKVSMSAIERIFSRQTWNHI